MEPRNKKTEEGGMREAEAKQVVDMWRYRQMQEICAQQQIALNQQNQRILNQPKGNVINNYNYEMQMGSAAHKGVAKKEGRPNEIRRPEGCLTPGVQGTTVHGPGNGMMNRVSKGRRNEEEQKPRHIKAQTLESAIRSLTPSNRGETTKARDKEDTKRRSESREPTTKLRQSLAEIKGNKNDQANDERGTLTKPRDPKRSIEVKMKTQHVRSNEDGAEGESSNRRETEEISGFERRMKEAVENAVETVISGMMELRSGVKSVVEESKEEIKKADKKWQEYREDIKLKHD